VRRDRRAKVAKSCGHILGVGNLIVLVFVESAAPTLILVVALTPFTLAMVLRLIAFLACGVLSLALSNSRDRAELLACAIGAVQPPSAGEKYREAMLAEIRAAPFDRVQAIAANLMTAAPRTILAAWIRIPRPLWERARKAVGASTGHPGS
jgi:hypothetical protein